MAKAKEAVRTGADVPPFGLQLQSFLVQETTAGQTPASGSRKILVAAEVTIQGVHLRSPLRCKIELEVDELPPIALTQAADWVSSQLRLCICGHPPAD